MACTGRYAEAWQFAAFWCDTQLLIGAHEGAGPADVALQDTTVNFINAGALEGVGQLLYNTTASTSGVITAVTATTLTATGVTWDAADAYRAAFLSASERVQLEHYLNISAGDIYAALGSVNACDCTYSDWGANFLAELNIVLARVFYDCPCVTNLTSEQREMYSTMANNRLEMIRSGEIDVCEGATGSKWPVVDWAEIGSTEFAQADIIAKDFERNLS